MQSLQCPTLRDNDATYNSHRPSVKFCIYHIKYELHCAIHLFRYPHFIYLGLGDQDNAFKALSSYALDSVTVVCFDNYVLTHILFAIFDNGLHSWIFTEKVTHRLARDFKFPILSGMEPVNSLRPRFLHQKMHTVRG